MFRRFCLHILMTGVLIIPLYAIPLHTPLHLDFSKTSVIGVRFDPSYYYNLKQPLPRFVDSTVELWARSGINCVFFQGYDPEYGAFYKTSYPCNVMSDYGKCDVMGQFIRACHEFGIRFFVWLWPFEHKEAWNSHPEWRIKKEDGGDCIPNSKSQYLCVRHEECRQWWNGFVADILTNYPDIDGIDLAEPAVVWEERKTCACPICSNEIKGKPAVRRKLRSDGLTRALRETIAGVHGAGKKCCLTFTATTGQTGKLLSFKKQIDLTGLDLDSLLVSPSAPDWISVEVMWQQWADEHQDRLRFSPTWTSTAVSQALRQIAGRSLLLAHVELSSFGNVKVTRESFLQSIVAARRGGAHSLEFYDAHLADSLGVWGQLKTALSTRMNRRAFLLYDSESYAESQTMAALCGHFDLDVTLLSVKQFRRSLFGSGDFVMYIGSDQEAKLPEEFLCFAEKPPVPLFWLHYNLNQLLSRPAVSGRALGFRLDTEARTGIIRAIDYKGGRFSFADSSLRLVSILDSGRAVARAIAITAADERRPYVVQSENFWYLADYTLGFEIGDRHVVFADLLHDFFNEDHVRRHCALVRIEDVTPRTDPRQIRGIADYFHKNGIPWSIALVPFYVDPAGNSNESLTDAPELAAALRYATSRGAAIVEHGVTHQYRGHSTDDFEFWDLQNERPLLEDCREYVASRLEKGLSAMHGCGFYPVVFETPHYGASSLDYSVINDFFSTEYGRRDASEGFGWAAPFYIIRHPTGGSLIPENCGYVSNSGADVKPILAAAENLLAVRDGIAGFFFHPWIDLAALRRIVDELHRMGYEFIDIRDAPLSVWSQSFVQYTGDGEAHLKLNGQFLHTFYLDSSGNKVNERYSSKPLSADTAFQEACPGGRIYVAEAMAKRPSLLSFVKLPRLGIRGFFKAWTARKPPLTLRSGAPARVGILWTGDSAASSDPYFATQYAWKKAFEYCGIPVATVDTYAFSGLTQRCNLAVVPSAAARCLTPQQTSELAQKVKEGSDIILEGPSPLRDSLGLHTLSAQIAIDSVADVQYPQTIFIWKRPETVMPLLDSNVYDPQYVDPNQTAVVLSAKRGRGRVIYFAAHFSAPGDREPTRFLFFPDLVQRIFNLHPVARSPVVEVYFEPTTRTFISEQSIVEHWRRNGVKAVYVALSESIAPDNCDYGNFVDVLHRNGIAAYCWISLPHVGVQFWEKHPRWRCRGAFQGQAERRDDYVVDIFNEKCRSALMESARVFLSRAQWDGINWTESIAKEDFPVASGVVDYADPARADAYRDSLEYAFAQQCIAQLSSYVSGERKGEIIFSRRFDAAGPMMNAFISDIARGGQGTSLKFQAQLPPGRLLNGDAFDSIVSVLAARFQGWSPMIELNLDALTPASQASLRLCGTELYDICARAGKRRVRVTLRTDANINNVDFGNLSFAFASFFTQSIGKDAWSISSGSGAVVDLDPEMNPLVRIDGAPWPGYVNGRLFFPAGSHTIESCSRVRAWGLLLGDPMHISNFSGNIIDAGYTFGGLTLHYRTGLEPFLSLSRNPLRVTVDGGAHGLAGYGYSGANGARLAKTTFLLPAGDHRVRIVADSFGASVISWISVHLSLLIVGVSIFTVVMFVIFYSFERVALVFNHKNRSSIRHDITR